jgi:cytochrome c oxidase cbb3-type subunit 3
MLSLELIRRSRERRTPCTVLCAAVAAVLCVAVAARAQTTAPAAVAADPGGVALRFRTLPLEKLPQDAAVVSYAKSLAQPAYAAHCARCHGADLRGDPGHGIPDLSDRDWLYAAGELNESGEISDTPGPTVYDIERTIRYGIRSQHPRTWDLAVMPAYGRAQPWREQPTLPQLTPAQIRDIVEYLLKIGHRSADAAAAHRGSQLFHHEAGCFDCHAPDGSGDPGIGAPNLTDRVWLYGDGSREAIYQSIYYGRQGVCPAWIDKLSPETIRALAVYLYGVSRAAPR